MSAIYARHVHESIDPAKLRYHLIDTVLGLVGLGQIGGDSQPRGSSILDRSRWSARSSRGWCDTSWRCARPCAAIKSEELASDAAAAGDQHNLAL